MAIFHDLHQASIQHRTRRHFLRECTTGLGALYLASMGKSMGAIAPDPAAPLLPMPPMFSPKVKRVIYLHMLGAPSTLDLFHYKPELAKYNGKDRPKEFLEGQRFAFIQGIPKLLGPQFPFQQYGQSGAWVSDPQWNQCANLDIMHPFLTLRACHGACALNFPVPFTT